MITEEEARADRAATLFSPERARELLAQAYGPLEGTRKRSPFYAARKRQYRAAVVAASTCLALHGRGEDAHVIADALGRLADFEVYTTHFVVDVQRSLAHFLAHLPLGAASVALVEHAYGHVRRAVAIALKERAEYAEGAALLRRLASDNDASVRAAAHASAPKGALPAWLGVFDSDPTDAAVAWARSRVERVAGDRAEATARALVATLCAAFVKEPWEIAKVEKKLAARCSALPDPLAVELARRVGSLDRFGGPSPLLRHLVLREGGEPALVDLVTRWHREGRKRIEDTLNGLYEGPRRREARRSFGRVLAEAAMSHEREERERAALAGLAAELLGTVDREWLTAWFVAHAESFPADAAHRVAAPLHRDKQPPATLTQWALDVVESDSALSRNLHPIAMGFLSLRPLDQRRALAARFVSSDARAVALSQTPGEDDPDVPDPRRSWALSELLDKARETAAGAPPLRALAEQLFAVPANRACMLASNRLVLYALPVARQALARRELTFPQARLVACAIRSVASGLAPDGVVRFDEHRRAKLASVLSQPEDLRDLDDEERAAYFALRGEHRFDGAGLALQDLDVVGRESAEGKELIDLIVRAAREGDLRATHLLRRELDHFVSPSIVAAARAAFPKDDVGRGEGIAYDVDDAQDKLDGIRRPIGERRELAPGMAGDERDAIVPLADVAKLARRALAAFDEGSGSTGVLLAHRRAAIALAAASAVLLGDTGALRTFAEALELERVDADSYMSTAESLTELVALSRAGDKTVKRLVRSDDSFVRCFVASGLRAADPESRALLLTLAADGDRDVRNAAKERLGEGAVPWWAGIFSRDPADVLSDDDAADLAPTFATIAEVLGPDRATGADALTNAEIARLSQALPPVLACDIARQHGGNGVMKRGLSHWVAAAAPREGGDDLLLDVIERTASTPDFHYYEILDAARTLPAERRLGFAIRLLRFAARAGEEPRLFLMQLLASLLRPEDAAPVADELLEMFATDDEAFEAACASLAAWFVDQDVPPPLVSWAHAHVLRLGDEERWWSFALAKAAIAAGPVADARRTAMAALGSPSMPIKQWGLAQMLGALHDPSLDGPRPARVRAFYGDPDFRDAMLADRDLLRRCLPLARADLRHGRLSFEHAHRVVTAVARARNRKASKSRARAARAPKRLRGTSTARATPAELTQTERTAYLAVRQSFRFEGRTWHLLDYDIIGTTTAVGQAHLAAAIAAVEDGDDEAANALGRALLDEADGALLDAGMKMAKVYSGSGIPSMLWDGLKRAHIALGVKLTTPLPPRRDDDLF